MAPAGLQVVVVGGTTARPVVEVVAALARRPGFAIIAWCPELDAGELRTATRTTVTDLVERAPLAANRIYLAPRDRRVAIEDDEIVVGGVDRAPLDLLFRSIADSCATEVSGIVLAGTGRDGSLGIKRIKEAGGLTIAQAIADGAEAEMPAAAIESGLIDLVVPLADIVPQLVALAQIDGRSFDDAEQRRISDATGDALREVLTFVRVRTGHDFTSYKRATLFRRIARRIQVAECLTLDAYHRYLRDQPSELAHLLRDLLISVTNFFRDGDAFAVLANDVIPRLFASKGPNDQVRAWIAGCATGEEAYSLGILLLEHAQHLPAPPQIQLFATDIDERALAEARLGCYPEAIAGDVSPERLQRFFMRENNQYRVSKELRELVLFSPHNVLRDSPFSRLDLVSCRNLMIYLNREAQRRVLTMFHFGLRPDGHLFLGSSETADASSLFTVLDARHRVFTRRVAPATLAEAVVPTARWQPPQVTAPSYTPPDRSPSVGELHYRLVESYAPPSALVDPDLDVVHLSEHAGRFLQLGGGELTRQILRLVHPALQLDLRTAIYAARQHGTERRLIRFDDDGVTRTLELGVRAVELAELGNGALLITFDEKSPDEAPQAAVPPANPTIEPIVRELEDDLLRTREQLRTTIEQHETSLEELKASNEELQAINEELRSATEELETSKEELQSVNEELTTLNYELKSKVEEISDANSDLQNLMASTEIGVIFLDRKLDIKRFTPRARDVFNLIPADLGRPLGHITHRLVEAELVENAQTVVKTLRTIERRVTATDGRAYLARWLPYRSVDDRIDGVVITVIDVSDLRDAVAARQRSEDALEAVEERLRVALRSAPIVVFSFDTHARLSWAYVEGDERSPQQLDLHRLFHAEDLAQLQKALHQVMRARGGARLELPVRLAGAVRTFDLRVESSPHGVTVVGFDISASKQAEMTLRDADLRKDEFLATLSHELRNPLGPLQMAIELARLIDHDPKQRAETLAVMERQVAMLQQLVDELLDLSRITHDKLELELVPLEVAPVLYRVIGQVRTDLDRTKQHLDVQVPAEPIMVRADLGRLVQVFTNLLTNAVKYTPAGGHIQVVLTHTADRAVIQVSDDGVGIESELLPHVFEIFVQSRHADGRSRGGLGVGLNVVRRLIERHGGTVTAASEGPGRGSTFTVELPLIRA